MTWRPQFMGLVVGDVGGRAGRECGRSLDLSLLTIVSRLWEASRCSGGVDVQAFDSLKPSSLDEALGMMSAGRVRPLAGGTDLMIAMNPDFSSRPSNTPLGTILFI